MLNTFFIVDCDQCGQQAEQMALWFDSVQGSEEAVSCLTDLLQQNGWHVFHQTYKCPDCVLEELHVNSVLNQPG